MYYRPKIEPKIEYSFPLFILSLGLITICGVLAETQEVALTFVCLILALIAVGITAMLS